MMGIKRLLKIRRLKPVSLKEGCPHCKFIEETFHEKINSNYEYWIVTEIFVYLHNGKCYCNYEREHKG